ncbi:hypothetical protein [uncultured Methylibium sp.]|uniref:hypothetical protein n=1 Tax=uncultured Methylibium sp. TaxID=381093 RepID=UPI0025D9A5A6|nr:hypothetical protein [uncultured Methylibium sp.]
MLQDTVPTIVSLNGQPADDRRITAVYRCKLRLDELGDTEDPDVKLCSQCQQKVFKVIDFDGFEKAVASKGCVWGPADIRPLTESSAEGLFLGGPCMTYYPPSSLQWDD